MSTADEPRTETGCGWRHATWCQTGPCNCGLREHQDGGAETRQIESAVTEALRRIDLRCYYYVGHDYRPRYDGCPANNRPRNGRFTAEQWCLPCEVRAALALASPQPASPGGGERP